MCGVLDYTVGYSDERDRQGKDVTAMQSIAWIAFPGIDNISILVSPKWTGVLNEFSCQKCKNMPLNLMYS
jgi:hypothetical protein